MRRLTLALIIVLAIGPLSGCGGDDADSGASDKTTTRDTSTAAKGPTKAEFIERGDALCTRFRERTDELDRKGATARAEEQADLMKELADAGEDVLDGFERLGTPTTGDTAALEEYKKVSREQVVLLRRAATALEEGETMQAKAILDSGQDTGARLSGIAQGYGFKVCGAGSD